MGLVEETVFLQERETATSRPVHVNVFLSSRVKRVKYSSDFLMAPKCSLEFSLIIRIDLQYNLSLMW